MNFNIDLGNVLAQAAKVTQDSQSSSNNGYKVVYPQLGELKVRLLYNNKSGVVLRKFERHQINNTKVVCLSNYGAECPICKAIDNIQNVKGTDLWKLKRTTRGIAYAEFVSANYRWDDPNAAPSPGEIIILMFPWSVYTDLNRLINSAGQQIYGLIASNVGGVFKITRWVEKGQTKYRAEIDPFEPSHQTRPTDEEYQQLIMDLPSLNDQFVPNECNNEIIKAARTTAEDLTKEYLSPAVLQPNYGQAGTNLGGVVPAPAQQSYTDPNSGITYDLINNQWIPRTQAAPVPPVPNAAPQPTYGGVQIPPTMNAGVSQPSAGMMGGIAPNPNNPPCFGKHGSTEVNPNQCLMCPSEATCRSASGGK